MGEKSKAWEESVSMCKNGQDCLCALPVVGTHKGGWNWFVEGIRWQPRNHSIQSHVHTQPSVLPLLRHLCQLLTMALGTSRTVHYLFTIFLKYNSSNKATTDLKGLQTEMMEILKVSFAFLPKFFKSVTPFGTVIELARCLLNHLLLYFHWWRS